MSDSYDRLLNREYMGKGWTNKMPQDPTHTMVRINKIGQRKADENNKDSNSVHKPLSADDRKLHGIKEHEHPYWNKK